MSVLSPNPQRLTGNLIFIPNRSKQYNSIDNAVEKYCRKGITTEIILSKLKQVLTNDKYKHSLSAAQKAEEIAKEQGLNPQKALLAGLLHDYAKLMPDKIILDYAKDYNIRITPEEKRFPHKLHAPIGAYLVEKEFGITDKEILRAIETHGIGSEDPINKPLEPLGKVIIIADKIEPYRKYSKKRKTIEKVYADTDNLSMATATAFKYKIKDAVKKSGKPGSICLENYNALICEIEAQKDLERFLKIN